ncbi:MAG: hypothetical protein QF878_01420, partial [SAR202 cluster bacterium]|nr:hypothetical protein [SAR202 cluster bacterium]
MTSSFTVGAASIQLPVSYCQRTVPGSGVAVGLGVWVGVAVGLGVGDGPGVMVGGGTGVASCILGGVLVGFTVAEGRAAT